MNEQGTAMITTYGATIISPGAALQYSNGSSDNFTTTLSSLGSKTDILRSSSVDIWGNVRIPKLEVLPAFDVKNSQAWVEVPYTS